MTSDHLPRNGIVLGLIDSQNDCGACVVEDGRVLSAVNEERLTGRKLQGGFPTESLEEVLDIAGLGYGDVDVIAVSGLLTPPPYARLVRGIQEIECDVRASKKEGPVSVVSDLVKFRFGLNIIEPTSTAGRNLSRTIPALIRKDLPRPLRDTPIVPIDHHITHLAGAYFISGRDEVLAITADGQGDGRSLSVAKCEGGAIDIVHEMSANDSFGLFYSEVTRWMGFLRHRHEGKTLGLSAHGDAAAVDIEFPFTDEGVYTGRLGRAAQSDLARSFAGYRKEDVAAWVQHNLEERMTALVDRLVERTGIPHLALSGGVFANVRLNQRLWELPSVKSVFVVPHMGDGGCAMGAALAWARPRPRLLDDVFLGRSYTDDEVERSLDRSGVGHERPADRESTVADLLAKGDVVGRFHGRAEWGPRALGNRSILLQATDGKVLDWLNERLKRTEFMPFAPLVLEEEVRKCFKRVSGARQPAAYMTITFDTTTWMREHCPGAVHVDGTARPQIVSARTTPMLHKILALYHEATGLPVLINTSFNLHESPMVYRPEDAIRSYKAGAVDHLAIGPFLASA